MASSIAFNRIRQRELIEHVDVPLAHALRTAQLLAGGEPHLRAIADREPRAGAWRTSSHIDICGEGNQCIGLNGDLTFCVKTCKEASECPEGYACTDDDGSAATGKICYPACLGDED